MIRMLALDVDGTLAVRGDEISPATRDALHTASEAGIEIAIATGRRHRTARRIIDALGLPVPLVCLGGVLIKDGRNVTVRATRLAADDYRAVGTAFQEAGLVLIGQRDAHGEGGADFVVDGSVEWGPSVEQYVDANRQHCETVASPRERAREDVLVAGTFGAEADLVAARQSIADRHPGRFASVIVSAGWNDAYYLEVIPAHVSKWTGILAVAEASGISPAAICAVGDERNDLPMVEQAAIGVAMGNAHPDLKRAADWVCGAYDEDGLVEVVEHLLRDR